jgi:hypothetical protein
LKKKDFDSIKKTKAFMKGDFLIYALILVLIFSLFVSFVFFPAKQQTKGFCVYKNERTLLTFFYNTNTLTVNSDFNGLVEKLEVENGVVLTIYTDEQRVNYNKLYVNYLDNSVQVNDSTCSTSKDCTLFPAVSSSGVIYCNPHGLKIVPLTFTASNPTTGFVGGRYEK